MAQKKEAQSDTQYYVFSHRWYGALTGGLDAFKDLFSSKQVLEVKD